MLRKESPSRGLYATPSSGGILEYLPCGEPEPVRPRPGRQTGRGEEDRLREGGDASIAAELHRVSRRQEARERHAPGPSQLGDQPPAARRTRQQCQQQGLSPADRGRIWAPDAAGRRPSRGTSRHYQGLDRPGRRLAGRARQRDGLAAPQSESRGHGGNAPQRRPGGVPEGRPGRSEPAQRARTGRLHTFHVCGPLLGHRNTRQTAENGG